MKQSSEISIRADPVPQPHTARKDWALLAGKRGAGQVSLLHWLFPYLLYNHLPPPAAALLLLLSLQVTIPVPTGDPCARHQDPGDSSTELRTCRALAGPRAPAAAWGVSSKDVTFVTLWPPHQPVWRPLCSPQPPRRSGEPGGGLFSQITD